MIELPWWNGLISVNGFCYSSSKKQTEAPNYFLTNTDESIETSTGLLFCVKAGE